MKREFACVAEAVATLMIDGYETIASDAEGRLMYRSSDQHSVIVRHVGFLDTRVIDANTSCAERIS